MILPVRRFIHKCKMGLGLGFRLDYVIDFFFGVQNYLKF